MTRQRSTFNDSFKSEVVKLIKSQGLTVFQAAKNLGITDITHYSVGLYNSERLRSTRGYMPPSHRVRLIYRLRE